MMKNKCPQTSPLTRRHFGRKTLAVGLGLGVMGALPLTAKAQSSRAQGLTVVELFTSQGCSSCPPADAYLHDLTKRSDVLALSLHVDYWNYIGWTDPFSSPDFTRRQRNYAQAMGLRNIYTPQMVVQGRYEMVGSYRAEVEDALDKAARLPAPPLGLSRDQDGSLALDLPDTQGRAMAWLVTYDQAHETEVRRGENAGRTIVNANVTRSLTPITPWNGQKTRLSLPASTLASLEGDQAAVVLQEHSAGPILTAAAISRTHS